MCVTSDLIPATACASGKAPDRTAGRIWVAEGEAAAAVEEHGEGDGDAGDHVAGIEGVQGCAEADAWDLGLHVAGVFAAAEGVVEEEADEEGFYGCECAWDTVLEVVVG